jgi:hypothetical protein
MRLLRLVPVLLLVPAYQCSALEHEFASASQNPIAFEHPFNGGVLRNVPSSRFWPFHKEIGGDDGRENAQAQAENLRAMFQMHIDTPRLQEPENYQEDLHTPFSGLLPFRGLEQEMSQIMTQMTVPNRNILFRLSNVHRRAHSHRDKGIQDSTPVRCCAHCARMFLSW